MEKIKLAISITGNECEYFKNDYFLEEFSDSHISRTAYIHRRPDETTDNSYHVLVDCSDTQPYKFGKRHVKIWDKEGALIKGVKEKHFKRVD